MGSAASATKSATVHHQAVSSCPVLPSLTLLSENNQEDIDITKPIILAQMTPLPFDTDREEVLSSEPTDDTLLLSPLSSISEPLIHLHLSNFKALPVSSSNKKVGSASTPDATPCLQKKQRLHKFKSVLSEEERKKNVEVKALRSLLPTGPDLHSCPCFVNAPRERVGRSAVGSFGSVPRTFQQQHRQLKPGGRRSIVTLPPQSPPTAIALATQGSDNSGSGSGSSFILSYEDGLSFSDVFGGKEADRMAVSQPLPPIRRRRTGLNT